jgi:hypothetical protein
LIAHGRSLGLLVTGTTSVQPATTSRGVVCEIGVGCSLFFKLWRRPEEPSLRYFVYVSVTKLNNLFDQISPELRQRLSAEAKVDLKLASLTVKEAQKPAATRMAKLKVVEGYIDGHHQVGTVEHHG